MPPLKGAPSSATLCEWGNGSYEWMLNELTSDKRLSKFHGKEGARLVDYFFVIAHSIPFYERWKDWRFNNRVYVPRYICELHVNAKQIFRCIKRQLSSNEIASETMLETNKVKTISREIIKELIKHGRMHLLTPEKEILYEETADADTESGLFSTEHLFNSDFRQSDAIKIAFSKLSVLEKHVISAFFIEDMPAKKVLQTLQSIDFQENSKTTEKIADLQKLYYFRRKSIKNLYQVFQTELENRESNNV